MSATFKNAKKKQMQNELRRFMNDHKANKAKQEIKKIESPLAKYNDLGQLNCILCKSVVRSEAVWTVHINSKQHRQNVELAKKLKERTNNFTTTLKRPITPPVVEQQAAKKIKGILKNSNKKQEQEDTKSESKSDTLPEDFFDSKTLREKLGTEVEPQYDNKVLQEPEAKDNEVLPEGFFDDPKLDAKARHQEYKDPVEEEWERFQKEIKEADNQSAAIIAEDQEEATTERQIDEIDEQMKQLSKVLDLEKKKKEVVQHTNESNNMEVDETEDDEEDENFDEFLDWRLKRSFE